MLLLVVVRDTHLFLFVISSSGGFLFAFSQLDLQYQHSIDFSVFSCPHPCPQITRPHWLRPHGLAYIGA